MRVEADAGAHRFQAGRPLRLGGLEFVGETAGLAGHSDGDAALHAVADALLGAARLGDIGMLFSPDDPRWRGADSGELLRDVARRVREAGWLPLSVDVTVVAVRPRIGPRRHEMERRMAGLLGCPGEVVTVKGTTSDGLGFGGSEGVAAYAVALLARATR
ncbi:MAG TPA: 2-C-methyl-D-erythritol 2,4-cyclodiphosphate synthase [Candidatus Limnocylindria bacterium]|nr:2-C-methyl-D-erythritol 2,4-cyclodiphosphate synthase [Candidatus Limnocylindria bacterium]